MSAGRAGQITTVSILVLLLLVGLWMWIRSLQRRWNLALEQRRDAEDLEAELQGDVFDARSRIMRRE